jgi:hypothetical protein
METAGALPPQTAARRAEPGWPRFDAPNVLWFFGFYSITFASIGVINQVSEAITTYGSSSSRWPSPPFT